MTKKTSRKNSALALLKVVLSAFTNSTRKMEVKAVPVEVVPNKAARVLRGRRRLY
jgi:hypothetical protein